MKKIKFMVTSCVLCLSNTALVNGELYQGSSNLTLGIHGYYPYMQSITAQMSQQGHYIFDLEDNPLIVPGSLLYVANTNCYANEKNDSIESEGSNGQDSLSYFVYRDTDNDECLVDASQLTWYLLDAKDKPWESIASWEELEVVEITSQAFPMSLVAPEVSNVLTKTDALIVPREAEGKRIGLIYTPQSLTGNPSIGSPVKVWDLNYIFEQQPPDYPGAPKLPNHGSKRIRITERSAGGEVLPLTPPPKIENLRLEGDFKLYNRLTAKYDFITETQEIYEDKSRFWWGPKGTTAILAQNNEQPRSNSPISPPITTQNIGGVYEVSVRPIEISHQRAIHGDVLTTTTDDHPNVIVGPSISGISIYYYLEGSYEPPPEGLLIGSILVGRYVFTAGTNQVDKSTYSWEYKATGFIRESGSTIPAQKTTLGSTPLFFINQSDLGNVLVLNITAQDDAGFIGNTQSVQIGGES